MWKWLRSWFAWRFSLRRLVLAVVFLGAALGLNLRSAGHINFRVEGGFYGETVRVFSRGWPFPSEAESDYPLPRYFGTIESRRMQFTHQTYLVAESLFQGFELQTAMTLGRTFNAFFATAVLALILFLQIPRRKAPE